MGSGVDGQVLSLLVDNSDNVYVGGFLTNYLVRWNGSSWVSIGASLGNYVEALATDRANNIYAGGPFGVRVWNGSTWTNLAPTFSGSIFTIYHDPDPNGEMYVGGFFSSINDISANNIARFQETTWFPLGTTINNYNGVDGFVFSIAKTSSNIFTIGGLFNFATQSTGSVVIVNNICQWISNLFYPIEQGGISGANDAVYAIVSDVSQNAIYVVGDFSQLQV